MHRLHPTESCLREEIFPKISILISIGTYTGNSNQLQKESCDLPLLEHHIRILPINSYCIPTTNLAYILYIALTQSSSSENRYPYHPEVTVKMPAYFEALYYVL